MKGLTIGIVGALFCAAAIIAAPSVHRHLFDFDKDLKAFKCIVPTVRETVAGTGSEYAWRGAEIHFNEAIAKIEECAKLDNDDDQRSCAEEPIFIFGAGYASFAWAVHHQNPELSQKMANNIRVTCGVE